MLTFPLFRKVGMVSKGHPEEGHPERSEGSPPVSARSSAILKTAVSSKGYRFGEDRMIRHTVCWLLCCVAVAWIGSVAGAKEPAAKTEKPAAKSAEPAAKSGKSAVKAAEEPAAASATYTVKRGPLKVTVDLEGIFEAQTAHEIFVKPEEWTALSVDSAVAHGARVRKGDVLLTLDTEKIDQAIADLRTDLKLSEVAVHQSEDQVRALEKTTSLDLELSGRAARIAEEDRKNFADVERPFALKAADFSLKMAKEMLEYEQEELRQLEKMYKADDITEETEQIVLKRARDTVEKAKFMVAYVELNRKQALKFAIPRTDELVKEAARRKSLDWEKNKIELPLALKKQRLELERLHVQRERSEEKLKKLLADRELMTVKSPIDGIVYYGKCVRGRFSDSTGLAENLRHRGSVMPNQVIMTVVQPRPMFIRAAVAEEQLHYLRPGLKGVAVPAGYPELKLAATIDDVSDVPTAPNSFDAQLSVALTRKAKWLVPGMTCKVKLVPYLKKDAISVPAKAVLTDELDDQKHYVWLSEKDGKPQRRSVTLGEKTDKQVEILKGLSEGEKVLLEPPKEQK
jgi:HlyD family secretion protein